MNKREATQIAATFYTLHKLIQGKNVIHVYMDADVIFDPSVQLLRVQDVMEISKAAGRPVVVHEQDDEDLMELCPFEVGITIESCYFFANGEQSDLDEFGLKVTNDA